jgi:predicted PurR-regulated permease PerM
MNKQGWVFTVVLLALAAALLMAVKPILAPFIAGLILAYLVSPLVENLVRLGLPRSLASALPVAIALVCLGVLLALGLPLLLEQLSNFLVKLPGYLTTLQKNVIPPQLARTLHLRAINADTLLSSFGLIGAEGASWLLHNLQRFYTGAVTLFNMLLLVVMTPLVAFYLLHDWPQLSERALNVLPRRWRAETREMVDEMDIKLAAYLRGQLAVCGVLAVFYASALHFIGLELGWALGIMAGLLAFIPVVGAIVAVSAMLLMALVQYQMTGWEPYAMVIGVYAVGQMLEGSVLVPALVGRQVGLHPVWVIFALLAGGEIAGIVGMLLAVPVAVVVSVALPRIVSGWHHLLAQRSD